MTPSRHIKILATTILIFIVALSPYDVSAQRKVTPVNTPHTATQPINEFKGDSTRIIRRMKESMKPMVDSNGDTIYVDTITGREWRDSTIIRIVRKPMQYPLVHALSIGVDIWNPVMRAFGQHYGLIDFSAQLSLHNRYKPTVETGIGLAKNTPPDNNFTFKSGLSSYLRLGADYNFLYNSSPDYQYFVGVRYGCSKFGYSIEDISITSNYWDETAHPTIPSQHPFVGWVEFVMGLKVQLWGPISAGWTFRYHSIMHESKSQYGKPWYIPGYGTRGTPISGSLNITYTLNLNKNKNTEVNLKE